MTEGVGSVNVQFAGFALTRWSIVLFSHSPPPLFVQYEGRRSIDDRALDEEENASWNRSAGPARTRNGSRWFAFTAASSRGRSSVNTSIRIASGRFALSRP